MNSPALVLEKKGVLALREIDLSTEFGLTDVAVSIRNVGICGSDLHYLEHGAIGPFVVRSPMVLGHEASGVVQKVGEKVTHLKVGDRVCMEPGIPDPASRSARLGLYNLDPAVRFWATPPVHGCLTPTVIHPANYTFKVADNVTFAEAAMVEPLAVGLHAASRAEIKPGDVGLVLGCGTIGILTALAALAAGCSRIIITDMQEAKLAIAGQYASIIPLNVSTQNLAEKVNELTAGWGVDLVFEASGSARAFDGMFTVLRPGGRVILIGMPGKPVPLDIVAAQVKEATISTIFRYAHVFDRALDLLSQGKINLKPLLTNTFNFTDSIAAFEYAAALHPESVKVQITFDDHLADG